MEILIKRLDENAKLPRYDREAAPGIDLYALSETAIAPGEKAHVSTGVAMAMPVGYIGLVSNLHGMSLSESLKITPARIDSSFREEIMVEIVNNGAETYVFHAGDRVAQLLVQQVHRAHIIEAEDLSEAAE